MAHEIETMAYVGAVPWHGLGNELTVGQPTDVWATEAGLDWTVSKKQVEYRPNGDGFQMMKPFKNRFVLARDSDDKPYAVVSDRYKPVQPRQILEHFESLVADYGMTLETAGSLRDGQRVWAMAKTNEAHKVMGVDEIKGYLMLATSYDLTFSTIAYLTSIRVVCNNTLQASFGDMVNRISVPHFKEFDSEDIKAQMGTGRENWSAFTKAMDTLAKLKLDVATATGVMNKVYKMDEIKEKDRAVATGHIAQILDLFSGKAIGSDIAGATGWGLVNATSEYLDQHKRARSASNRLDSAWFGDSFGVKQRVVDTALELAA